MQGADLCIHCSFLDATAVLKHLNAVVALFQLYLNGAKTSPTEYTSLIPAQLCIVKGGSKGMEIDAMIQGCFLPRWADLSA